MQLVKIDNYLQNNNSKNIKIMKNFTSIKEIAKKSTIFGSVYAFKSISCLDKNVCDKLATEGIRNYLNSIKEIGFVVKIGEGEMDEAPMLYNGEILGNKNFIEYDVAVDPLDCTTACSVGLGGAISVVVFAPKDQILKGPDVYMTKLASCSISAGVISLEEEFKNNVKNVAKFKNKRIDEVSVILLERDRHLPIIEEAKSLGVKVNLIKDGDIMAILKTFYQNIDFYIGIGGSPEGVISASFAKNLGGFFEGKFQEGEFAGKLFKDFELVGNDSVFSASSITGVDFLLKPATFDVKRNLYNIETIYIDKGEVEISSNLLKI